MLEDSSFNLAVKYIHQKQYQKAENILQNLIKTLPFDESVVIYYGYCLIEQQKYEEALAIYRQFLSINSDQYKLLRAYCYAKMGFIEKALNDWLKLSKEGNKTAISILNDLKKAKDNKAFLTFLKYNKACNPLPSVYVKKKKFKINLLNKENDFSTKIIQRIIKIKLVILVILAILIILGVIFFLGIYNKKINNITKNPIEITSQQNSVLPVTVIYTYKDNKQIDKDLNLAKKYLSQSDYNNARLLLNKIIYSNADIKYKEKSKNIINLLTEPFFNKLTFNPSFNEVIQNPLLYSDLFIQWKAIVYDLIDDYNFSIMIYSKNPIYIDGIGHCVLPKPFPLFVKQQIEIFGKIISVIDNKIPKIEIKNIRVIYE